MALPTISGTTTHPIEVQTCLPETGQSIARWPYIWHCSIIFTTTLEALLHVGSSLADFVQLIIIVNVLRDLLDSRGRISWMRSGSVSNIRSFGRVLTSMMRSRRGMRRQLLNFHRLGEERPCLVEYLMSLDQNFESIARTQSNICAIFWGDKP